MTVSDAYFVALGRFIHGFSVFETALQFALCAKAGIADDRAQVLFAKVGTRDAIEMIERLHRAEDEAVPPMLLRVIKQHGVVAEYRNAIVHHGAVSGHDGLLVTTAPRTAPGKGRFFPISPEMLADLTYDTETMTAAVNLCAIEVGSQSLLPQAMDLWGKTARRAWLCKSKPQPPFCR